MASWTSPRTYTTGEVVTAAMLNTHVRDNLTYLYDELGVLSAPNLIADPSFDMWTMATTITAATTPANNDDTYVSDVWLLLSDGNDIVDVSYDTASPRAGSYGHMKFDVQTANKKLGAAYFLEGKDVVPLQDQSISFSVYAKTDSGNEVENIRVAILSWDGAEDTVTSDVVSAWNAEGADPTWAANWTAENTPGNTALTTSWARIEVENVSIDTSGTKNIAIVIWVDDTDCSINDILRLDQAKFELASAATTFETPEISETARRTARYFQKWPDPYVAGGIIVAGSSGGAGQTYVTNFLSLDPNMRTTPTCSILGTWNVVNSNQPTTSGNNGRNVVLRALATAAAGNSCYASPNSSDDGLDADARL